MNRILSLCLGPLLFTLGYHGNAQNTFNDPYGVFAIDLEDDLKPVPQIMEQVYSFKGAKYNIIAQKNVDPTTLAGMYATTIESLRNAGIRNPKPTGPVKRMFVNGNAAQMATYSSFYESEGVKATLFGVVMAIELGSTYMGFMGIINEENHAKYASALEQSYASVRAIGQEVSGLSNVEEVAFDMESITGTPNMGKSLGSTMVTFDDIALILPDGWSKTPKNRGDGEMILGKISNEELGANCTLMGLKGLIWNRKNAIRVAEQSASSALPGSKILKNEDVRMTDKQKARLTVCQGQTFAQGKEVTINMTYLTHKVGKYYVIYILTNAPEKQEKAESAILSMAESAKI